ncbi:hypothetical protein [Sphingomonas sp.]|uniref:hypothetical protein n=1 Tax=Sphingomonas sp. TaxID=28214 RepID=UPI002CDF387D|nr:hypothetical protein [Sphingomonas sp.]HWK35976.1 hypothetical protein [Sphingomonas sp.]
MKLMLLASALVIAAPAMAQDQAAPPSPATPIGGYQPSTPPLQGTPQPGVTPVFQQAPPPDQAYPAPAPLAEYPICKKGQTDQCKQRVSPK